MLEIAVYHSIYIAVYRLFWFWLYIIKTIIWFLKNINIGEVVDMVDKQPLIRSDQLWRNEFQLSTPK